MSNQTSVVRDCDVDVTPRTRALSPDEIEDRDALQARIRAHELRKALVEMGYYPLIPSPTETREIVESDLAESIARLDYPDACALRAVAWVLESGDALPELVLWLDERRRAMG